MTTYVFVRHGECVKNLEGITGGGGASLTSRGVDQVRLVGTEMAARFTRPKIVSCPPIQAVETADLIATTMGCDYTVDERLAPAGMGALTGLRQEEIEQKYPDCSRQLGRWRNFEIEAYELQIPGIEPPTEFWSRTLAVLSEYQGAHEIIVVATRSIAVFAANLHMNRSPGPGGGYKHVAIDHCQIVTVNL